jgi:hypothetical protein
LITLQVQQLCHRRASEAETCAQLIHQRYEQLREAFGVLQSRLVDALKTKGGCGTSGGVPKVRVVRHSSARSGTRAVVVTPCEHNPAALRCAFKVWTSRRLTCMRAHNLGCKPQVAGLKGRQLSAGAASATTLPALSSRLVEDTESDVDPAALEAQLNKLGYVTFGDGKEPDIVAQVRLPPPEAMQVSTRCLRRLFRQRGTRK